MAVIAVNESVRRQLEAAKISPGIMNDCLNSKFMIARYDGDKIAGVCFVMGALNAMGTEVSKEYRGRGLSHALLADLVSECKSRNMHFLTGAFKPSNTASVKSHTRAGFVPVFTVHYNRKQGKEIAIMLPISRLGRAARRLAGFFDTRPGNALFVFSFWCSGPLLRVLTGLGDAAPRIDLAYSLKNFEKVSDTMKIHHLDTSP